MVIPRGCRRDAPCPNPIASGRAPSIAAKVVIIIGRNRKIAALKMASLGSRCSPRSNCNAKSIIRIAFFFTMPINRITPIKAIMVSGIFNTNKKRRAPIPAEGMVDRIVIG